MTIDYMANIVTSLYASDVAADADYQTPGNFSLPVGLTSLALDPSSTIAAGGHAGTGYAAGDVVTLTGGTHTTVATVKILTVSGGAVVTFRPLVPGVYSVLPSNPISTTTTGGGSGFEITGVWQGFAAQRLLTFIEIMRSYLAEVTSVYEAKLLQSIMRRMVAEIHFGYTYNAATSSLNAKTAALHYLNGNEKSITGSNLDYGVVGIASQVSSGY
jgi:hypothetical protein